MVPLHRLGEHRHKWHRVNNNNNQALGLRIVQVAMIFALLLLSTIAFSNFKGSAISSVLALEFPQSQKLDLMVINSGSPPTTSDFNLTKGYQIQPLLWNLSLPSSVTFDDKGRNMYVAESGYIFGDLRPGTKILKVDMHNQNVSTHINISS